MRIQILGTRGCSHREESEGLLREVAEAMAPAERVEVVEITSGEQATALRFAGSPTILVDGADLEPDAPVVAGFG